MNKLLDDKIGHEKLAREILAAALKHCANLGFVFMIPRGKHSTALTGHNIRCVYNKKPEPDLNDTDRKTNGNYRFTEDRATA